MADRSISQLPEAGTITGDELTVVVQNGVTKQTQVAQIANAISPGKLITSVSFVGNDLIFFYSDGTTSSAGPIPGYVAGYVNGSGDLILTNSLGFDTNAGSVVGPTGATGATGPTGPTGPAGAQGDPGTPGAAASITVGSTSTLSAGSYATVANSGTSSAAILDFGIPMGAAGAPGAQGAQGPVGPGVAPGGNTGQVLAKVDGNDYNTEWIDVAGVGTVTSVDVSGGSTGLTSSGGPITTGGTITLAGTVNVAHGGSGATSLTGYLIGNGTSAFTASSTIPTSALSGTISNAQLANSAITIGSTSVSLGSTITTLAGVTISGATNTLTNIGNSSLTNSSVTIGTTSVALGATSLTLDGLTTVTVTQDPTSSFELATKQYVDNVAQGVNAKASCLYTTTADITLTGLTTQVGGDWPSSLTAGDRILVKNQTLSQFNGIYLASATGWTRSLDMNTWAEVPSSFVFIQDGSTLADTGWVTTANATGTIDVTAMPWVQFSGAGTYLAGTGLSLIGNTFSITNTAVTAASYGSSSKTLTATVNAQGQLTALADTDISIAPSQINATIPNSGLTNSSVTINGSSVSLGGSTTITAANPNALTIGSGLGGTSYDGSAAVTITNTAPDQTVVLNNGTGISVTGTYPNFTITNTAPSSGGTVTSVSGTGTVNGLTLTGTVTSSGSLTLGGTLDLSSPPAIGGTLPAAITGTTITATKYVGISGGTF